MGACVGEVTDMQSTYKAILRGERIEWEEDVPKQIRDHAVLTVFVTIPDHPGVADKTLGARMAEVLQRLALSGRVTSIADPLQWQREQREDREAPGRR